MMSNKRVTKPTYKTHLRVVKPTQVTIDQQASWFSMSAAKVREIRVGQLY